MHLPRSPGPHGGVLAREKIGWDVGVVPSVRPRAGYCRIPSSRTVASVPALAGCSLRFVLASGGCIEGRLQLLRVLGRASRVALQGGLVGIVSPLSGFAFVTSMCQCAHPFEVFVARVIPSRLNDIIVLITVFVNKISFKLQHSLVGWVVVTDIGKIKFHDGLPDGTNQFCKIS